MSRTMSRFWKGYKAQHPTKRSKRSSKAMHLGFGGFGAGLVKNIIPKVDLMDIALVGAGAGVAAVVPNFIPIPIVKTDIGRISTEVLTGVALNFVVGTLLKKEAWGRELATGAFAFAVLDAVNTWVLKGVLPLNTSAVVAPVSMGYYVKPAGLPMSMGMYPNTSQMSDGGDTGGEDY